MSSTPRSQQFVVKLYPEEHQRLKGLAAKNGVSLSEAFRQGAEMYLTSLHLGASAAYTSTEDDKLLTDLQALAGRVDRRIRRGR